MVSKIKIWADKFENKTAKIVAFYGALVGFISLFPTIATFVYFSYNLVVDLYNISKYVKEFKEAVEYDHFMIMQLTSVVHGETDSKIVHGIEIERTNVGDSFIWSTVEVNGVKRPIIYSANIKQKADAETGAHIYVTDINGNHLWIKK